MSFDPARQFAISETWNDVPARIVFTHLVEEGVGDVGSCDKCGPITCRLVQRTPRCFMSNLSCLSVIEAKMCP